MTLAAVDATVAFDGRPVFEGVSLAATPGEVLTVVGPSGAGKSSLLRLLAAFRPPDGGRVTVDGEDVWSLSSDERLAVRRRTSVAFQAPSLFNDSVARNVTYGLRVRRSWRERARRRLASLVGDPALPEPAREALATVGMADAADRDALTLSGGEAQRVAFARALAVDPDVLLLDEPTSNLDPRNTAVIEAAVDRARERGVGVVLATHDMHQARRLSDRVAVLLDGDLVETGPPERVFESPSDDRTERFVSGELVYDA